MADDFSLDAALREDSVLVKHLEDLRGMQEGPAVLPVGWRVHDNDAAACGTVRVEAEVAAKARVVGGGPQAIGIHIQTVGAPGDPVAVRVGRVRPAA